MAAAASGLDVRAAMSVSYWLSPAFSASMRRRQNRAFYKKWKKMKLFQYWDGEDLPADIAEWSETFRCMGGEFEYILYNRDSGSEFIRKNYGDIHYNAFRSLKVPAMQADYLRLCLLDTYGGLYCDIDHRIKETLSTFVGENPGNLMLDWNHFLNNAILLFREPGNPYLRACLDLCTDNIINRRFETAIMATGPGVQNAIRVIVDPASLATIEKSADLDGMRRWGFYDLLDIARDIIGEPTQELRDSFSAITVKHSFYIIRWMSSEAPAYKSSDRHWLRWSGPIYED